MKTFSIIQRVHISKWINKISAYEINTRHYNPDFCRIRTWLSTNMQSSATQCDPVRPKFCKKKFVLNKLLDNISEHVWKYIWKRQSTYIIPLLKFKEKISKALIEVQNAFLIWNKSNTVREQQFSEHTVNTIILVDTLQWFPAFSEKIC